MTQDLFVRRLYTHANGISITIEIDYVNQKVSLVEKDGSRKQWLFADRTLQYMNGWRMILTAMDWAVEQAQKELEAISDKEREKFVKLYMGVEKALKNPSGVK